MEFKTIDVVDVRNELPQSDKPSRAWRRRAIKKVKLIAVHHTAGGILPDVYDENAKNNSMAQYHINKNWGSSLKPAYAPTLSYHFTIGRSGKIYFCNDLEDITWQATNANDISLGIALHGDLTRQDPSQAQLEALNSLLKELTTQHPEFPAAAKDVYGHKELKGRSLALKYGQWSDFANYTVCPGNLIGQVQEFRNTGMIAKAEIPPEIPSNIPTEIGDFTDIPDKEWFTNYAKAMIDTGVMRGFDDKTWRPAEQMTRAQTAKIVIGALLKRDELLAAYKKYLQTK